MFLLANGSLAPARIRTQTHPVTTFSLSSVSTRRFREEKNSCGALAPPTNNTAVDDLIGDLMDNLAPTPAP